MSKISRMDRLIGVGLVVVLLGLLSWALVHRSNSSHAASASRPTHSTAASRQHPAASTTSPPTTAVPPTTTTTTAPPATTSTAPPATAPATTAPAAAGPVALPVPGPVTAVGDSIMLDIQPYLATDIPGATIDGMVSRQFEAGISVVEADRAAGTLGNVLVVELGTNGTVTDADFDAMMQAAAGVQRVVFVNVDVPRDWEAPDNAVLAAGVARYPGQAVLADWYSLSVGHPEWFTPDQVHLEPAGAAALANLVAQNA
jgi:hypothetical protein